MTERLCRYCNEAIPERKIRKGGPPAMYCSRNCRNKWHAAQERERDRPITQDCRNCGERFMPAQRGVLYCSKQCKEAQYRKKLAAGKPHREPFPCPQCGEMLTEERANLNTKVRYCSTTCTKRAAAARHGKREREDDGLMPVRGKAKQAISQRFFPHVTNTVRKGEMAVYFVMADLMGRGHEVYKAANPGAFCDLVVLIAGTLYSLEVKVGRATEGGAVSYGHVSSRDGKAPDMVAVVLDCDRILYEPSLESLAGGEEPPASA